MQPDSIDIVPYRSGELILTHFSGEPLAAHTIDHRLTMVDLFVSVNGVPY